MSEFAKLAKDYDKLDDLSSFRDLFHIPKIKGHEAIYFTGNSLGLQPKSTKDFILEELDTWAKLGVEGHFHATRDWFGYHKFLTPHLCPLLGALADEVVAMNTLTTNLHLLLLSFYKPQGNKKKILIEYDAFPSDVYACQSQIELHGHIPQTDLLFLKPKPGNYTLETQDIFDFIQENQEDIALVLLGGINYYTGQRFDMPEIAKFCQQKDIVFGLDLAHAIGNIELNLHDWGVDFATWCSYKYLNSGPGGVSGIFVHQKHAQNSNTFKLKGWWGNDPKSRFQMSKQFEPIFTAESWQLSNAQILPKAAHLASLEIFSQATLPKLIQKAHKLSDFAYECLASIDQIQIITPKDYSNRGCQLSIVAQDGKALFDFLTNNHIITDWRSPDVIRIAPVPLYNTYQEVFTFSEYIRRFYAQR
ncbi:MAG: kynureninase [Chitinophagales bacterium]|nr:kynureninase [Chitinophagales bacterium]